MSQIEYRYGQLEEEYDRLIAARGNARIERSCLNAIMRHCWALMIAPWQYLRKKEQEAMQRPTAMPVSIADTIEYRCNGCGKDFGSKQARGAHSKYCKKEGSHNLADDE